MTTTIIITAIHALLCISLTLYALILLHPRSEIIVAWYDIWVGFYWDREKRRLYYFPVPCLGLFIQMPAKQSEDFTDDPEYQVFVEKMAEKCQCHDVRPCDGLLAGGMCDNIQPDRWEPADEEHD